METNAPQLVAKILFGLHTFLNGDENRSSGNFSTESLPSGTQYLKWEVDTEGMGDPNIVLFNVMNHVSDGTDPVVFHDVLSGKRTSIVSARSLYIANPKNVVGAFTVNVYAIF
ncbi:DeoR family transcriptional regulator [Bacillus sp. CGMCC 1.60114]|uniref:DeoR family transcriptional regulator n=1 Tax=unclassified Bacillus (in: firmicutes) TaxID=185979 RepID=UPI00363A8602